MESPILVVFTRGGQLNYNIWCSVRDLLGGSPSNVKGMPATEVDMSEIKSGSYRGIIVGGGPLSFSVDKDSEEFARLVSIIRSAEGVCPLLGICLGHQAIALAYGGDVSHSIRGEYGESQVTLSSSILFQGIPKTLSVWVSHFDEVDVAPPGFRVTASSPYCKVEAMECEEKLVYSVQFHPEVEETQYGRRIFYNFLFHVCGLRNVEEPEKKYSQAYNLLRQVITSSHERKIAHLKPFTLGRVDEIKPPKNVPTVVEYRLLFPPSPVLAPRDFVRNAIKFIQTIVKDKSVLLALSGGIDSSVTAELLRRAVKNRLWAIHIDHGFMRKGESKEVVGEFEDRIPNLIYVNASKLFYNAVVGKTDAEEKRLAFSNVYFKVLNKFSQEIGCEYISQGTIWPDIIESMKRERVSEGSSSYIKSQHNVSPPKEFMSSPHLKGLVEPVAGLFKNEERPLAAYLSLPPSLVFRMPFPGPGLLVRIVGEVTIENIELERKVNEIVEEEVLGYTTKTYGIPIYINEFGYHVPWQAFGFIMRDSSLSLPDNLYETISGILKTILVKYNLTLEDMYLLEGRMTGVKGDNRTYTFPLVIKLRDSILPSYDCLCEIFRAVTSVPHFNISRVLLELERKNEKNGRRYVAGIRAVISSNAMTAKNMPLPSTVVDSIASKLLRFSEVSCVVYDFGHKPSETIEPE
ncbi:hypothetical protein DRN93_01720 [archaeon]|nr:MAG: hypothetical protein DRN93_01720 [archaeon]